MNISSLTKKRSVLSAAYAAVLFGEISAFPEAKGISRIEIAVSPVHENTVTGSLSGILRVNNGCTYLQSGRLRRLIIWPPSTVLARIKTQLIIVNGLQLRDGSGIDAYGGEISPEAFHDDATTMSIIKRCRYPLVLISQLKGS